MNKLISRDDLAAKYGIVPGMVTKTLRAAGVLPCGSTLKTYANGKTVAVLAYGAAEAVAALDAVYRKPEPIVRTVDPDRVATGSKVNYRKGEYRPTLALRQALDRAAEVYGDRGFIAVTGREQGKWRAMP